MFTIPGSTPPAPSDLDTAISSSVRRFDSSLRAELGMMAHAVPVHKYLSLYKAELEQFVAELRTKGVKL